MTPKGPPLSDCFGQKPGAQNSTGSPAGAQTPGLSAAAFSGILSEQGVRHKDPAPDSTLWGRMLISIAAA